MKETKQMTLQLDRKVHDSNTCPTLKHKNTVENKNTNIQKHEQYAIGKTLVTVWKLRKINAFQRSLEAFTNSVRALPCCLVAGLPPELYTVWEAYPWRFGEPYCLLQTFLAELTSTASVFTITAFTVERYVAICHPLRAHATSSLPRVVKTIVFIWLAGPSSSRAPVVTSQVRQ